MIKYKTPEELKVMQEGGKKLKSVVKDLMPQIRIGMTTNQIDEIAEELIIKAGGEPSFKRVKDYHWSTCLTVNEQIVHTPPSERVLKNGDILTVDIGMFYKGFNTDFSDTIAIGKIDEKKSKFLETGKKALEKAIKKVEIGGRLGLVSESIQRDVEAAGYSIIRELTGHGVGEELHEDPIVPGYLDQPVNKTLKIQAGLVIAVEVIYATGKNKMTNEPGSDWSIITADRSLAACFEHTVAVTDTNTLILT